MATETEILRLIASLTRVVNEFIANSKKVFPNQSTLDVDSVIRVLKGSTSEENLASERNRVGEINMRGAS